MKNIPIDQLNLVLLGAGHAQISVLKTFGMNPVDGINIILITDVLSTPYSGMLPSYIEGKCSKKDFHIDLTKLSNFCKARLIHTSVKHIDPIKKTVFLENYPSIYYDILSINTGSVPNYNMIPGAKKHAISVKPISKFINKIPNKDELSGKFIFIGGGKAGIELSLAFKKRADILKKNIKVILIEKNKKFFPQSNQIVEKIVTNKLKESKIDYFLNTKVTSIKNEIVFTNNGKFNGKKIFLITPAQPPEWIKKLIFKKDKDGFILVKQTLQTLNYPDVFATGDIASVNNYPRQKSGVYSVRAGKILSKNILLYIYNKNLINWIPQNSALSIIGFSNNKALALKGVFFNYGKIPYFLKKFIDKKFMNNFLILPKMKEHNSQLFPLIKKKNPSEKINNIYCSACGSKTEIEIIKNSIIQASKIALELGAKKKYIPQIDFEKDIGETNFKKASKGKIIQSIDFISQHISDPFIFGRIAALHSLSDIFASNSIPKYALSMIVLKRSRKLIQENDLLQILAGSILELSNHKTILIGGHTTTGIESSVGFSITGEKNYHNKKLSYNVQDYDLILTKPLGIGVMLAGMMRNLITSEQYQETIKIMLESNYKCTKIIGKFPNTLMTDVTGFGLAQHSLNLSKRIGSSNIEINISKLNFISGALDLSYKNIQSSIFDENKKNINISSSKLSDFEEQKIKLIFDPQTSGGILAAVPKIYSNKCLEKLKLSGYNKSSIIGKIINKNTTNTLFIKK